MQREQRCLTITGLMSASSLPCSFHHAMHKHHWRKQDESCLLCICHSTSGWCALSKRSKFDVKISGGRLLPPPPPSVYGTEVTHMKQLVPAPVCHSPSGDLALLQLTPKRLLPPQSVMFSCKCTGAKELPLYTQRAQSTSRGSNPLQSPKFLTQTGPRPLWEG